MIYSFRLLTEYHSFLSKGGFKMKNLEKKLKFPSPYGVSFILIFIIFYVLIKINIMFPSPYGVSFILIIQLFSFSKFIHLSSFRLLTEYHSFLLKHIFENSKNGFYIEFPSPYGVSFILI